MFGHGRMGQAMALLLFLGMTAALAWGCLQCDPNFSEKFSFYRHHVNLKSWWVGDIPVSGVLLSEWSHNTMKELHLAIPAEITRKKLHQVAEAVYQRMDQLYQGKMYFPGYFPNELRAIFREQVRLIQNAIIESEQRAPQRGQCSWPLAHQGRGHGKQGSGRSGSAGGPFASMVASLPITPLFLSDSPLVAPGNIVTTLPSGRIDCQRHCGIFQYETISCSNCTDSHVVCFGYYCKSSPQWESAVQGLLKYINTWHKQDVKMSLSQNIRCLEPQHLVNLTLENASECLTQH
nr:izumo sperm-egg fusion protein 4 isoform X2 [Rattus norvegicus]